MEAALSYDILPSLYVQLVPDAEGLRNIRRIANFLRLPVLDDYHCTVMHSPYRGISEAVARVMVSREPEFIAESSGIVWWPGHNNKGYLVLQLFSAALFEFHKRFKRAGARSTFPDYRPHITLAEGVKLVGELEARVIEYNEYYIGRENRHYLRLESPTFDIVRP